MNTSLTTNRLVTVILQINCILKILIIYGRDEPPSVHHDNLKLSTWLTSPIFVSSSISLQVNQQDFFFKSNFKCTLHSTAQKIYNIVNSAFIDYTVTKQYNLVLAKCRWYSLVVKVTAGLAESNGILPPGLWLVTCGLTA